MPPVKRQPRVNPHTISVIIIGPPQIATLSTPPPQPPTWHLRKAIPKQLLPPLPQPKQRRHLPLNDEPQNRPSSRSHRRRRREDAAARQITPEDEPVRRNNCSSSSNSRADPSNSSNKGCCGKSNDASCCSKWLWWMGGRRKKMESKEGEERRRMGTIKKRKWYPCPQRHRPLQVT